MDRRISLLQWATLIGALVALSSEILSLLRQLNTAAVAAFWILTAAVLLIVLLRRRPGVPVAEVGGLFRSHPALFLILSSIALILGFLALWSAPNNYDSMTYHMSRILHWKAQQSLSFYPTHILRQIYQAPFAEMSALHLQLLTGSDRFANLIQFASMIGALIGVSHLAKLLGGSAGAQWLAAVCAATIPMGILQSTSTQNDYVMVFWLVCFVNFLLPMLLRAEFQTKTAMYAGSALGLGILTKQSMYFYALPFLLWLLAVAIKRPRASWKNLALVACCALVLNAGMYLRNWECYGTPIGTSEENAVYKYSSSRLDWKALTSNVARSTAVHIGAVPWKWWRTNVLSAVLKMHAVIGIDVNDPQTTWPETTFAPAFTLHEDNAGNFAHIVLSLAALALLVAARSRERRWYALCALAGFVLFCWLVSWSHDRARMHLAFFVLMAPGVALAADRWQNRAARALLISGLLIQSLPFLFLNQSRPLAGPWSILDMDRTSQYFVNAPHLQAPYYRASRVLNGSNCREVGLILGGDDYEYPLWVLTGYNTRFTHVAVNNYSSRYARAGQQPCALISRVRESDTPTRMDDADYTVALRQDSVIVLLRSTAGEDAGGH